MRGTTRLNSNIEDSIGQYSDFSQESEVELYAAWRVESRDRTFNLLKDYDPLYPPVNIRIPGTDLYQNKRGQDAFFLGLSPEYMDEITEYDMPAEMLENTL